jgi:hypothetical protein
MTLHGSGIQPKARPSAKPAITAKVIEPTNTRNMDRGPVPWRASVVVSLGGPSRAGGSGLRFARLSLALATSAQVRVLASGFAEVPFQGHRCLRSCQKANKKSRRPKQMVKVAPRDRSPPRDPYSRPQFGGPATRVLTRRERGTGPNQPEGRCRGPGLASLESRVTHSVRR